MNRSATPRAIAPLVAFACSLVGCGDGDGDASQTGDAGQTGAAGQTSSSTPSGADAFGENVALPLSRSCGQCHGEAKPESGLVLSGVSSARLKLRLVTVASTEARSLNLVTPFEPENSFLLRKVRGDLSDVECKATCGNKMPLGNAYPEQDIMKLEDWIKAGAL